MSDDATRGASQTAIMVAAYRARATAAGYCHDPWAAALAGAEGEALAADYDRAFPPMTLWLGVRSAVLDDEVRARIAGGFGQIVILGAGLDTRAARLAAPGVRFFEVDHQGSQADKRARLAALPGYPVDAATYVDCDFEHEDFLERLRAHGFAGDAATLFVWEGVSYYLSQEAVQATLARVAAGSDPRSVLAFDLIGTKLARGQAQDQAPREHVAALGEPLRFGTNDVVGLCFAAGFRHVDVAHFDELCLERTGTWERERMFRFQAIARASVATRLPSAR